MCRSIVFMYLTSYNVVLVNTMHVNKHAESNALRTSIREYQKGTLGRLLIHSQCIRAAADLSVVTLARHVARRGRDLSARWVQHITAETLPAIFCASNSVPICLAKADTSGGADCTDIRKLNASERPTWKRSMRRSARYFGPTHPLGPGIVCGP